MVGSSPNLREALLTYALITKEYISKDSQMGRYQFFGDSVKEGVSLDHSFNNGYLLLNCDTFRWGEEITVIYDLPLYSTIAFSRRSQSEFISVGKAIP